MVECKCDSCGISFLRKKSQIRSVKMFCNNDCRKIWMAKERAKARVPKKRYSCSFCGEIFERLESKTLGKKHLYCSRECKNEHNGVLISGENHHRWNPDLSESDRVERRKYPEYLEWRSLIYVRDNYTCQRCGDNKGGNLAAHHIYNYSEYPDIKTNVDNGITLCTDCHKGFHDNYGYTNNDEFQLLTFINDYYTDLEPSSAGMR